MDFYNKDVKEVLKELDTSIDGLSLRESKVRLDKYGENKIIEAKDKSKFGMFVSQFDDMMIIVLLVVAFLMFFISYFYNHDYTDSIVIFVVVFINAIIGFIQELKAHISLKGLKDYSVDKCKVRRDNNIYLIDSSSLVLGDIILLDAGDKVCADARIIKETGLKVSESALTGESFPVSKFSHKLQNKLSIQEQNNMLFMGSNLTNGNCEAVVTKTGMNSELGRIATSLNTPYKVPTPLELKINEISKKLTYLIFLIIIFIFIFCVIKQYKLMETIMLCVSVAVAAIPEGLPAVISITLSNGASLMAKKKTIVKNMSAIETLGSTDVICTDKTGTITENKMTVDSIYASNKTMLKKIALLCNNVIVSDTLIGDPTETSLIDYYYKDYTLYTKYEKKYPRIDSIPFDSNRKMMTTINNIDGKFYCLTKGSLESILSKSIKIDEGRIIRLTNEKRKKILSLEKKYANKGLRVMAYAYKVLKDKPKKGEYKRIEDDLIFVGLVGIIDNPREYVKESVLLAREAGIKTVMITGDSLLTAVSVAKSVGIIDSSDEAILGSNLDDLSDYELDKIILDYSVFARVSPIHKQRIVTSFQRLDKVVAMTGDGVNDAPAIKDAHVGVGMGITGTEITKSVADIILLDDSYSTIVEATKEGRRIYSNIRNNVVYSISSNLAEIFVILVGLFTGNTILVPIHILFIDLLTDSIPSICIAFETAENDVMKKAPRGLNTPLFTPFLYAHIISSSIIETMFVLVTYFITLKVYGINVAQSVAIIALIIQEIAYAFSCRNLNKNLIKHGILTNKAFNIGIIITLIIQCIFLFTPVRTVLHIETMSLKCLIYVIAFNLSGIILYEYTKYLIKRDYNDY